MPIYTVTYTKLAQKQLEKLPVQEQARIVHAVADLTLKPRPPSVERLVDAGLYRHYGVIYDVDDGELGILVVRLADRKQVDLDPARKTRP